MLGVLAGLLRHAGQHDARGHGIDANALRGQLQRHGLGQHLQRCLGSGISNRAACGPRSRQRGHIHHAALAGGQQRLKRQNGVARPVHIHRHGALPQRVAVFAVKGVLGAQARIVDQQQLVARGQLQVCSHGAAGCGIRHIQHHGLGRIAGIDNALRRLLHRIGIDIGHHHMGAHGGQFLGHGPAYALACAGDEGSVLRKKMLHEKSRNSNCLLSEDAKKPVRQRHRLSCRPALRSLAEESTLHGHAAPILNRPKRR